MATEEHEWSSKDYAQEWVSKDDRRAAEREAQFKAAARWLAIFWNGPVHVADVGCGPGTFAQVLLREFPQVSVVCLDGSREMLELARQRLGAYSDRVSYVEADFSGEEWKSRLPEGLDGMVSARAIHNLRKLKLVGRVYRDICQSLRPGGLFLNIERVNFSTPALRHYYRELQVKERGRAAKLDGPAPSLLQQFRLLKRAGFRDIDCFWRDGNTAIVGGFKGE